RRARPRAAARPGRPRFRSGPARLPPAGRCRGPARCAIPDAPAPRSAPGSPACGGTDWRWWAAPLAGPRRYRRARRRWYREERSRRRNLAALGGGSKLAVPQAEQLFQLAIQAAEALQVAGGEGRVGLCGELLRPSPPRRERRVGGRARLATRGKQAPECGRRAPALAPVLPPGKKHRVDAGGWTSGGRLAEQRLLEEEGAGHVPEAGHGGRRRVGGPDEHRRQGRGRFGAAGAPPGTVGWHRGRHGSAGGVYGLEGLGTPR